MNGCVEAAKLSANWPDEKPLLGRSSNHPSFRHHASTYFPRGFLKTTIQMIGKPAMIMPVPSKLGGSPQQYFRRSTKPPITPAPASNPTRSFMLMGISFPQPNFSPGYLNHQKIHRDRHILPLKFQWSAYRINDWIGGAVTGFGLLTPAGRSTQWLNQGISIGAWKRLFCTLDA